MLYDEPAVSDSGLHQMLIPEMITPEQYGDRNRRERVDHPEIRLMLAVLEDAISTYKRHAVCARDRRSRRLFDEVDAWLRANNDDGLYSFERICAALRIEPSYLRHGLESWRENQIATGGTGRMRSLRRMNPRRPSIGTGERRVRKSA